MPVNANAQKRPLSAIAEDIYEHWSKVHYTAAPYLEAMAELTLITDTFYDDTAASVVNYFLSNASSFRGEEARRIKDELKAMVR